MAAKKKQQEKPGSKSYDIIVSPLITEKTAALGGEKKTIVFEVCSDACKTQIREAVEKVFNVKVDAVRTVNVVGKIKRTAKSVGRRAGMKKAYVTLQKGQSIELVEGL